MISLNSAIDSSPSFPTTQPSNFLSIIRRKILLCYQATVVFGNTGQMENPFHIKFSLQFKKLLFYVASVRSQYPEGPATGHLDTGFSWFPRV
jgi:hypothetical protein